MLAHLYGTPAKMDEIIEICKKYGIDYKNPLDKMWEKQIDGIIQNCTW